MWCMLESLETLAVNKKILFQEMNLAPRTVLRVLREDLGLRAYKRC